MFYQWLIVIIFVLGCSSGKGRTDLMDTAVDKDIPIETTDAFIEMDIIADQITDAMNDTIETITPPIPWSPEARGYNVLRGIVHLHSYLSHDGCTEDHENKSDEFFKQCLKEERDAACSTGIDFMMQTDHPSDVKYETFEQAVHYQPENGDVLINDSKGRVIANKFKCPDGSVVSRSYLYLGTEGSKQMPIGLSKTATPENGWKSVDPDIFSVSYENDVPLEQAQAAIAKVHESGGFAFVAHSEESNISVERIVALPLDGIEIFNIHPMLLDALGQKFDQFLKVDYFMELNVDNPVSDLAFLMLFGPIVNDPIKFDAASVSIRLTAVCATDIHRNVELPSLCPDGVDTPGICQNLYEQYPNLVNNFVNGGPVILSDGDRFDSYARGFRFMANRTIVKKDAQNEAEEIRQAVGHGRLYVAFDIMGSPQGFDFFAWADDKVIEMGEEVKGVKDVTLYVHAPTLIASPWGIKHLTDYSSAIVKTKLIRATSSGSSIVQEAEGQGVTFAAKADLSAMYRVEVWVTPKHLKPALKNVEDAADIQYPYIYSNGIFLR